MEEDIENTKLSNVNNSDVVKKTLISLIIVATSKTSDDYAWSSIKTLLKELKLKYGFLKYITIGELESLKYTADDINISTSMNDIESKEIGRALQDLIDLLKKRLGKKAGYFFLQEFKEVLGDRYHSIIKDIGVDLRLIELQNQIKGLDGEQYKIKDNRSSNIAFIERV